MIFKQKCTSHWIFSFMLSASLVSGLLAGDLENALDPQNAPSITMKDCEEYIMCEHDEKGDVVKEYTVREYVVKYPGWSDLWVEDKTGCKITIVPYLETVDDKKNNAYSFDFDNMGLITQHTAERDQLNEAIIEKPFYLTNSVHLLFYITDCVCEKQLIIESRLVQDVDRIYRYIIRLTKDGSPPRSYMGTINK